MKANKVTLHTILLQDMIPSNPQIHTWGSAYSAIWKKQTYLYQGRVRVWG